MKENLYRPVYRPSHVAGYTVLELMVTLGIVGILASLIAPGFIDSIRRNARESSMLELMSSISLARSEAVSQGRNVSICRSVTQTNCAGVTDTDWDDGWIVFSDSGTAGTKDGADVILQVHAVENDVAIIKMRNGSNAVITGEYLQFDEDGFLTNTTNGAYFKYCDVSNSAANARAVWVFNTGRASLSTNDLDGVHNNITGGNLACP